MSWAFPRDPGDLGFQPIRDAPGRLLRGERVGRGSLMDTDPDERDERMPREAYPSCTVELGGQPVAGLLVERAGLTNRVGQDVSADEH